MWDPGWTSAGAVRLMSAVSVVSRKRDAKNQTTTSCDTSDNCKQVDHDKASCDTGHRPVPSNPSRRACALRRVNRATEIFFFRSAPIAPIRYPGARRLTQRQHGHERIGAVSDGSPSPE